MRTAKQIADDIKANVAALHSGAITFEAFDRTQRRLWDEVDSIALKRRVCKALGVVK